MKSVDDVVAELRLKVAKNLARDVGIVSIDCDDALALCQMAADFAVMLAEGKRAISALQSEADRLRKALEPFAKLASRWADECPDDMLMAGLHPVVRATDFEHDCTLRDLRRARAALSATQQDASPAQTGDAVEALRERIDELEEKLIEARQGPWPEWAEKLLRLLEEWGCEYDADDEINLPDELAEWLNGYAGELRRVASPVQPAQKTEGA